ncbi:MAG: GNAT family N-acetyltransferase [Candidatus Bathyarchaeia archaeon]|jgi:RimJ/RimL family protein N-acetyltransferase
MVIDDASSQKPIIQIKRLDLRAFRESDWAEVHEYGSDPLVVRFMNWGPNTEEETRNFIQKSIGYEAENPRMRYSLAIVVREQNRLVGGCGLYLSSIDSRIGWIGYCLNRQFWGQGYATETARSLLEFGFNNVNLHRNICLLRPRKRCFRSRYGKNWDEVRGTFQRECFFQGEMAR